jgi:hypothetical protein
MGLRIVDFDPNDYKLGEVLAHKHGEKTSNKTTITNILSLYFQWKEESKAFLYFEKSGEKSNIEMNFDEEERDVTQLFIGTSLQTPINNLTHAFIRLETFDNCFEFEAEIIDTYQENGLVQLIVSIPTEITIIKSRKAPRVQSSGQKIEAIQDNKNFKLNCLDLGLKSLKSDTPLNPKEDLQLLIRGESITATVIEQKNGISIIFPVFKNFYQFGLYFEFYAKVAYPSLKRRGELPFKEGTDLFDRTGYTGKFESAKNVAEAHSGLYELWAQLEKAQHETTVDFYITEDGKPTGSSSLALIFKRKGISNWAFHQLCAEKKPDLIELTGLLYIWRAEYLSARPEESEAVFWYTGTSRWLERIYSKYCMLNPSESLLFASSFIAQDIEPQKTHNFEILDYKFGDATRYYFEDKDIVAGMGPDKLNANRNLNVVNWISKDQINFEKMKAVASALAEKTGNTTYFRFSFPYTDDHPFTGTNLKDLRYCQIHKSGLLNFISCIQHSIAITKKKFALKNEKDCA